MEQLREQQKTRFWDDSGQAIDAAFEHNADLKLLRKKYVKPFFQAHRPYRKLWRVAAICTDRDRSISAMEMFVVD